MPSEKSPLIELGAAGVKSPLLNQDPPTAAPNDEISINLGEPATDKPNFDTALGKYAVAIIVGFLALGTIGFHYIEGTGTWWDALYFSCVTLTTVGYGDLTPSTDGGKVLAIFFILIGLSVVAASIGILAGNVGHISVNPLAHHFFPPDGCRC
jgi:hypothetical protein